MNKTAQREAILEELRSVDTHPTADELYVMLRRRMPQISLGTVYRNLEQLSQLGVIQKLATTGKQKRFDGNVHFHHHMRCEKCDAVVDLHEATLQQVDMALMEVLPKVGCSGFYLEFFGVCRKCRQAELK
ncbi:transcriptional repressor [Victivallis sp. Marseille-Q1083]|uniref:Fur family transcriptional regulator n=1 Tax=Victivallis sp. Marseille-Q1083 TaxID=2717288 RepID=UPI00158AB9F5|nr:transcriptional repressor [Victivallis sp. Marseille-Q1083]